MKPGRKFKSETYTTLGGGPSYEGKTGDPVGNVGVAVAPSATFQKINLKT